MGGNLSTKEILPANSEKLDVALRAIGYSFETAVADVVDNSIDAKAKEILIRLIYSKNGALDLVILDDGKGMLPKELKEAMRFGSDISQETRRLGKFGLGLKLASLSQAKELHVFSMRDNVLSGRAWLAEDLKKGFSNTVYEDSESKELVASLIPDQPLQSSGTLIWWSNLYRTGIYSNVQEHAQKLMIKLERTLSLAFHRFLSMKIQISIDIFDVEAKRFGIPSKLKSVDPFAYPQSGHANFPKIMEIDEPYKNKIQIKAHIWPPNSTASEYKLPGGSNSRQGFYFYRNNRLIQGGGWNGLREAEAHSSLARVEIDVEADFDIEVSLNVKKTDIYLTQDLLNAIQKSKAESGMDFKGYLALAEKSYRKRENIDEDDPLIPTRGLPKKLISFIQEELSAKKFRELEFLWVKLDENIFFQMERDNECIYLNNSYRKIVLRGQSGSVTDAPLIKCLLFFVLEEAMLSERISSKKREKIDMINKILIEALKYESGLI